MRYGFMKGVLTGVVVGAATAFVMDPNNGKQRRRMQRQATSFFKNVGSMIDSIVDNAR